MQSSRDLARTLLQKCRDAGVMIATAESCTGGMIAAALTDIPGSSDVFDRGFVSYSYLSKTDLLGVSAALLATDGAVSERVAKAMAAGARDGSRAGLTLAVTGVAGPGASDNKPEGMVWFGCTDPNGATAAELMQFGALGRDAVRAATVRHALTIGIATMDRFSLTN